MTSTLMFLKAEHPNYNLNHEGITPHIQAFLAFVSLLLNCLIQFMMQNSSLGQLFAKSRRHHYHSFLLPARDSGFRVPTSCRQSAKCRFATCIAAA